MALRIGEGKDPAESIVAKMVTALYFTYFPIPFHPRRKTGIDGPTGIASLRHLCDKLTVVNETCRRLYQALARIYQVST